MISAPTLGEQLLYRALAYLEGAGLEITPEVTVRALTLVELVLQHAARDQANLVFSQLMDRLPQEFDLPRHSLPPLSPPIKRGSIGYTR